MMKKMFNEIKLCNPITCIFKEYVKIIKIYMVKSEPLMDSKVDKNFECFQEV